MAGTKITGAEYPLKKIFSDDFVFEIPRYQRPYSWTTEQAGELLDDLLVSLADSTGPVIDLDPYFLGSIVLIKEDNLPDSDVVDGQQRLTTLTLLLSALAHLTEGDEERKALWGYVFEKGNAIEDIPDRPRLTLRSRDAEFFAKFVQTPGALNELVTQDPAKMTDPQRNIRDNAKHFLERLSSFDQDALVRLSRFLLLNCFLVAVSTPDLNSAYRIFSVLNERGLDLSHADILKSEIIGKLPEVDQDSYTTRWEDAEEALGRDNFGDMFAHVRMIFAKRKMREGTLKEFRTVVIDKVPDNKVLINDVIVPNADAYRSLLHASFETAGDAAAINQLLRWLDLIDNADWIPPAMKYLVAFGNDPGSVEAFLTGLDRLASSMQIRGLYVNPRIERYGKVLEAIERGEDLFADDSPLQLTAEERSATMAALDGPIYTDGPSKLVLLRLDAASSSGGANYDYPLISVEHVLPQVMQADSTWTFNFDDEIHGVWVHRIANLVLLTRRKNSQAQNYEFDVKKAKYFLSKGGVSPFAITTEIINEPEWTVETLERRQAVVLDRLSKLWELV